MRICAASLPALKSILPTDLGCGTEEIVFEVLKSLSVLVFDYARPNSIAEHHDRTRAQQLASGANQANLYDALFGLVVWTCPVWTSPDSVESYLFLLLAWPERCFERGQPDVAEARMSPARVSAMHSPHRSEADLDRNDAAPRNVRMISRI